MKGKKSGKDLNKGRSVNVKIVTHIKWRLLNSHQLRPFLNWKFCIKGKFAP